MLSGESLMGLIKFQRKYAHVEGLKEDMDVLIGVTMDAERKDKKKYNSSHDKSFLCAPALIVSKQR